MKTPVEVLLIVGVLFVQGCVGVAYVPGVEKTDLSAVYEETATRSEIEAVLGEPVASRTTDEGSVSLYPYNRGAEGGFADQQDISDHPVGLFFMLTTLGLLSPGVTPFLYADKFDSQKGFLAIIYSADDTPTNVQLSGSGDPDALMDRAVAGLDRYVAGLELKQRADDGDVEAMYQYAFRVNDRAEFWKYGCLAANQNYPDAQGLVADHYRQGRDPVKRDLLRAYVWYRLAEMNGYEGGQPTGQKIKTETGWKCCKAKPYSEVLADNMTPSELADGERLVSKWKPNPAECEREAKLAAD
jgi:hypothetical protein